MFGFLPTKSSGDFNIDLKSLTVVALASLTSNENSVEINDFDIRFTWKNSQMKFSSQHKSLDKIGDFVLNKVRYTISELHYIFITT